MKFSKFRYITPVFSLIVMIVLFYSTFVSHGGFARSLDFDGGIALEIEFPKNYDADKVRALFADMKPALDVQVTTFTGSTHNIFKIEAGRDVVDLLEGHADGKKMNQSFWHYLKSFFVAQDLNEVAAMEKTEAGQTDAITRLKEQLTGAWQGQGNKEELVWISSNKVGPSHGVTLRRNAVMLLMVTMFFIIIYLTVRFEFRFGVAALVALVHDLIIVWGLVGSLQIKPSVPLIAALLTILGYSINDTIVIFDRVRENMRGNKKTPIRAIIDDSITQSLSRTMITSLTTLVSVICLYSFGGVELQDFSFVLIIGIFVGTYSSLFIASPILIIWDKIKAFQISEGETSKIQV